MKFFTIVILSILFALPAFAGTGHSHGQESKSELKPEVVSNMASKKLAELINKGKLEKSWSGKKAVKVEQKMFSKGLEWVVVFQNENSKRESNRVLYMFYTLDGKYIAANFTGN